MTDEAHHYNRVGQSSPSWPHRAGEAEYGRTETVNAENMKINTNTVEGYYSIFKRGMKGVYQHCAEEHLHRYLAEFDFRYNNRIARDRRQRPRGDRADGHHGQALDLSGTCVKRRADALPKAGAARVAALAEARSPPPVTRLNARNNFFRVTALRNLRGACYTTPPVAQFWAGGASKWQAKS